jgi:DNA polymerase I-like protein with 3'-5' exonuclease and polymerase domains
MVYPSVRPIQQLRATLGQMRLENLAVGPDGRNRVLLSCFRAKTGRNAPSTAKFIFGPATWLRHLIRPEPGHGIAYIDWRSQEFAIAAALSGDQAMQQAYHSTDPYLTFAKQAQAVPETATKETHGPQRECFKACILGVAYGMGAQALAYRIGQTPAHARMLLDLHHQIYPQFWRWSEGAVNHALVFNTLETVFGWRLHVEGAVNTRSLRNYSSQGNGAEMLRLACCLATEAGVEVCAPVHDALVIHGPLDDLSDAIATTKRCMEQASSVILDGFRLQTDVEVYHYPQHYQDKRGQDMWKIVQELLTHISI